MSAAGRAVYPDPSALQRQVDQIVDAPPVVRGEIETRADLRHWVMNTFRDPESDLLHPTGPGFPAEVPRGQGQPACRCVRCGVLLDLNTMTIDRIKPGAEGGQYVPGNVQPACRPCNSAMGAKRPYRLKRRSRAF